MPAGFVETTAGLVLAFGLPTPIAAAASLRDDSTTTKACSHATSHSRDENGEWACPWLLPTTGSGRFPVRGCAPDLSRIVNDQGKGTPERLTSDVQLHWRIRRH
jgi:hypothetical protein